MAHKGSSGGSLGGAVVYTRKAKQRQRNTSPCPECGAGKGSPCQDNRPGKNLRPLHKTHRSQRPEISK